MSEFPRRYVISGETKIGKVYSVDGKMSTAYNELYFHIQFFSDEAMTQEVRPSAGTIEIQTSPDGSNFYNLDVGGSISLASMYDPTFTLTSAQGPTADLRLEFLGVDVASAPYFKACVERY
ncbi:hypothetical protein vBVpaS1601_65 [Vibrio phage vB_VpaS_1601]|uniref:hypothetical protein n=1 Tax=Vibrio phage SHOU24 TaxID=1414739 RepID=UPI0003ED21E0|nr:hypothetical protein SHOU24_16 [Vibrio phage SHOU24]AHI61213.1 hypothetical protein SHOU24_16 [Vibrio phage SHOU24]WHM52758.1 hypothetical protein vBVpaP1601_65 [Vibrio phage vB_VpaP_1601]